MINVASVCMGDVAMYMNDTDVKLPSPPVKSGTGGWPFSLYTGSITVPPPTWNTIGTRAS